MPTFNITGDVDPFLHVSLRRGEMIYCERDGMVMMESNLDLKGKMSGGIVNAVARRLANGESFFQQEITAVRGDGDCLLSPVMPGGVRVLDVGTEQYMVSDGAFVAASSGVEMKIRMQNIGNALFANTGGFLITESAGKGHLIVSGFGSLFELDVTPGQDVLIDNSHIVAWDSRLRYELTASTSQGSGFLSNLISSQTSGEGFVLKFSGTGKVLICSRNRTAFLEQLRKDLKIPGA